MQIRNGLLILMVMGLLTGCAGSTATAESEIDETLRAPIREDEGVVTAEADIVPARWSEMRYANGGEFFDQEELESMGCVLTELHLPDMTAIELLARVEEQMPSLPVLIIAGESDIPRAVRAMKAGANDFLQKPVADRVVVRKVRDLIFAA